MKAPIAHSEVQLTCADKERQKQKYSWTYSNRQRQTNTIRLRQTKTDRGTGQFRQRQTGTDKKGQRDKTQSNKATHTDRHTGGQAGSQRDRWIGR